MKNQLAKGVMWLSAAKVMVNVLALCSTFVLARILTPDDFGLVAIATTILAIFSAFTDLSLAASLIHHADPSEKHFHTAWTMNLIRAACVAACFSLISPLVASYYNEQRLEFVIYILAASVFLGGFSNPKVVFLTRQLVFWQEFVVMVTQKIAGVIASIVVALIFESYWALLAGVLASQIVAVLISYLVVPFRPTLSLKYANELWSFSIWLSLGQIVNTLNWKMDHFLIGAKMGPKALGLYTVGDSLASLPTRESIGPLEQALFPGLRSVADDTVRLRSVYQRAQAIVSAVALPMGVLFALLAEPLVRLVLGEKWMGAVIVVQILAPVFALQTMASAVHPLGLAKGETRLLFFRDMIAFFIRTPIIAIAAMMGGLVTVLYARFFTGILAIGMNMAVVKKILGISHLEQLRNTERSLLSVSLMAIIIILLKPSGNVDVDLFGVFLGVIFTALSGGAIYVLFHYIIWVLMGRPDGIEVEINSVFLKLMARTNRDKKSSL